MTKAASLTIGLVILSAGLLPGRAESSATDLAIKQAVQRQADTIALRQKLETARGAEARKDLVAAAQFYEEAYKLVQAIGDASIPSERTATISGLTRVRLELARAAQKEGDYFGAQTHGTRVIKVDPQNEAGLAFMQQNDRILKEMQGRYPDQATVEKVTVEVAKDKVSAGTHVQNGRMLLEAGKVDEAEKELKAALKLDAENATAFYYLSEVKEKRFAEAERRREQNSKDLIVKIEQDWSPTNKAAHLPVPNSYATNNLVWTGSGRQLIVSKLASIKLDLVQYDGVPLSEVVRNLSEETKRRDPLKRGLNIIINPNVSVSASPTAAPVIDPATGLPVPAPQAEAVDVGSIPIKISPALTDMRLSDVLNIIIQVAEKPIKYSIEEWGIMFGVKGPEAQPLFMREFKVDPNTFVQGLESVGSVFVGGLSSGGSGGGGGGRGGGGGGGGGGQGGQQQGDQGASIPRVNISGGQTSSGGGGRQGGQQGGGGGGGVSFLTRTNSMEGVHAAVRNFFLLVGIDLQPPKNVLFNDRAGILLVNATTDELDKIEKIIQVLNVVPHQVNIKAKFAEITQNDQRGLGFDWYLGNILMGGRSVGLQGGTAPSYGGQPTVGNPAGTFPGTRYTDPVTGLTTDTTIPASTSDGQLSGGLRNLAGTPAVMTLSGILTDPQFRVVVRAMEQRDGVDLLNAPEITTPSGRQAQIQIVDIQTIVSGTSLNQTSGGGGTGATGGTGGGGGPVGTTIDYPTTSVPIGTTLDVVPYISADGYTIQMTIIPTITEFVGYDDPGAFVPQGQGGSLSSVGVPITAQLPLPRTRVRQVTTSAIVWDGQTVVLGGLISEDVTRLKDKVPLLGDLPFFGKLFRSESSATKKKNLVIFVTPTIIDPAGNRVHQEGTMPFEQTPVTVGAAAGR